jgi:hypothetical protein
MGVGSNNWSHTNEVDEDYQYEADEEGEGLIDAPKGRASNYTIEEDVLICNTWLNVSMDATVGTDQTKDTYWLRMKEFFDTHNTSGIERTERSLRSRWSTINKDCQKWASAMKSVDTVRDIFGSRDCPGLDRVISILSLGGVLPSKSCTQYILALEAQ